MKDIEQKSLTDKLNDQFQAKLDDNKRLADEKTAKKRAKRQKKKKNLKRPKTGGGDQEESKDSSDDSCEEDEHKEIDAVAEDKDAPEAKAATIEGGE